MSSVKFQSNGHSACDQQLNGHSVSSGKCTNGNQSEKSHNGLDDIDQLSYDQIKSVAKFLLDSTKHRPKIGIICGSGLGSLGEGIENADVFPYHEIPHFPVTTVEFHSSRMVFGTIKDVPVMCMQGRFHYYEGYSLSKCCMPVRVMKLIGITHLVVTNAAGSINVTYNIGDIMIIKDHINLLGLSGISPLRGPNEKLFGPRFLPMNKAYDKELREQALEIAHELGLSNEVHEGVYLCTGGPTFETVAECRMLQLLGADCVGMSTVHETTVARHCDIKVIAISFVSNKCITDYDCDEEPDHEGVVEVGKLRQPVLTELVRRLVARINAK